MVQTDIYNYLGRPLNEKPITNFRELPSEEVSFIPKRARYYNPKFDISVEKKDLVLFWTDSEGAYDTEFRTEVEAWDNFVFWCLSATKDGEINFKTTKK